MHTNISLVPPFQRCSHLRRSTVFLLVFEMFLGDYTCLFFTKQITTISRTLVNTVVKVLEIGFSRLVHG